MQFNFEYSVEKKFHIFFKRYETMNWKKPALEEW